MMNFRFLKELGFVLFLMGIVACGGGSSPTPPPPPPPPASDTTPDVFSFSPKTTTTFDTYVESESVVIGGINASANVSISNGEYSINGGDFTNAAGSITKGQSIVVRVMSQSAANLASTVSLNVGGITADFVVTTEALDQDPEEFVFSAVTDYPLNTDYVTSEITVAGINAPVTIEVENGSYSINGGAFTSENGEVSNGDSIVFRTISSSSFRSQISANLRVGNFEAELSVTTTEPHVFLADDGTHGKEVWVSDGSEQGTMMLKDIREGPESSNPRNITQIGEQYFFVADDGVNFHELWITDGTAEGTRIVIATEGDDSPSKLIPMNGILYYSYQRSLWRSDGTESGTYVISEGSVPYGMTVVGNNLYFNGIDSRRNRELFKSDGTVEGTGVVAYLNNELSLDPSDMIDFNGTLYFIGRADDRNSRWVKSDGTEAGTQFVSDLTPRMFGQYYPGLIVLGDHIYFIRPSTEGAQDTQALWRTDGTHEGTTMVKDLGVLYGEVYEFHRYGNEILMHAEGVAEGESMDNDGQLWKTDGTEAGTVRVKVIRPGTNSYIQGITDFNGEVYFSAYGEETGQELWKTDGTEAGTVVVENLISGTGSSSPYFLKVVGEKLFYFGFDWETGHELRKYKSGESSELVKDINPGDADSIIVW